MDEIARVNEVTCYNTLTGFKYIVTIIRELDGKKKFITGGEESYGYMVGDFVRDKDAVVSCLMIAEMAAWAKNQGKTMFDILKEIYVKYGFYMERLLPITKKGISGAEEIKLMMKEMRSNPPKTINGSVITRVLDFKTGTEKNIQTGQISDLEFPQSDVLQYYTEDGSKISARPSGTEPKIKFYFSVNDTLSSTDGYEQMLSELNQRIDDIVLDLKLN